MSISDLLLFMAALCNKAGHIYFHAVVCSSFFPCLISAVSGLKFIILWGHVEEILLLNKFFSHCRYMP